MVVNLFDKKEDVARYAMDQWGLELPDHINDTTIISLWEMIQVISDPRFLATRERERFARWVRSVAVSGQLAASEDYDMVIKQLMAENRELKARLGYSDVDVDAWSA